MQRSKTSAKPAWVAWLILLLAFGCDGERSRADQARKLLERIARVHPSDPFPAREQQLEALRSLPLAEPDLVELRDVCSAAHAGLLAAEREQADVRARLDAAGSQKLPEQELSQLAGALAQAGQKLGKAQAVLPKCEQGTRELLARYR